MRFHAVSVQIIQQQGRNLVVQGAFPPETGPFDVVETHGNIRIAEDYLVRVVGREDLFLVALENAFFLYHFLK